MSVKHLAGLAGLLLLAFAGGRTTALAQEAGAITGVVTNKETGQPLSGAQITVSGTTHGGTTNEDGRFLISGVSPGTYSVVIQFLGFGEIRQNNVHVDADGTATLDAEMETAVLSLQEVVVSGSVDPVAGVKKPYTVATVGADQLQVATSGSALSMISGKVAGAYVTRATGEPGSGVEILLRSASSFERSNSPMIVVDGVILARDLGNTTSDFDMLDIENIEIIKGAAAASLYGSRAAAGVVSITTKRGSGAPLGQTRITSRTEFGQNVLAGRIPVTNTHQYLVNEAGTAFVNEAGEEVTWNGRVVAPGAIQDRPYPGRTFDNLDQLYNPGNYISQQVSFSQAMERTSFLLSMSRRDDAGALVNNDGRQQTIGRLAIDHRIGDKLSLSLTAQHSRSHNDNQSGNPFTSILTYPQFVDLTRRDADGNYIQLPDSTVEEENPLWRQGSRDNFEERTRTLASLNFRYSPQHWLTLDAQLSYDRADTKDQEFVPKGTPLSVEEDDPSDGLLEFQQQENTAMNGSVGATVIRQFGDLNARLAVRGQFEREDSEDFTVGGENFWVDVRDLSAARDIDTFSSGTQDIRAEGYLADLGLDYKDRYIASVLVRRDGSSLFGPEEKWHTYKRANAKYRISEEPWFNVGWINELGLRYAMGEAGERPNFTDQFEQFSISRQFGLTRGTGGNPQLKPGFTREQEWGIDLIGFNNRVQVELVYARTTTRDIIITVPATVATGFNSVRANAGVLKGRTYEATVQAYPVRTPNFSWSINANADNFKSVLTEWGRSCFFGSNAGRSHEFTCAGQQMGDFWIFSHLTDQSQLPPWLQGRADEFDINDEGYLVWVGKDPATGEPNSWRDGLNNKCGQEDGLCWGSSTSANGLTYNWGEPFLKRDENAALTRENLGSSSPDVNFGFGTNFTYKGLSLFAQFRGQLGGKIYNRGKNWFYNNLRHGDIDQSGKPDELKKSAQYYQRGLANSDNCNAGNCGSLYAPFLEDGSYLKFSELMVRYRFGQDVLRRVFGSIAPSEVALGIRGSELFTLTGFSGFNPEAGSALSREEWVQYPHLRTLTATLDITF